MGTRFQQSMPGAYFFQHLSLTVRTQDCPTVLSGRNNQTYSSPAILEEGPAHPSALGIQTAIEKVDVMKEKHGSETLEEKPSSK